MHWRILKCWYNPESHCAHCAPEAIHLTSCLLEPLLPTASVCHFQVQWFCEHTPIITVFLIMVTQVPPSVASYWLRTEAVGKGAWLRFGLGPHKPMVPRLSNGNHPTSNLHIIPNMTGKTKKLYEFALTSMLASLINLSLPSSYTKTSKTSKT